MVDKLTAWLQRRSAWSLTAVALGYVAVVGLIDSLTPAAVLFAIFYLPAIMVVTWFAGRAAGFLVATTSAMAWLVVGLRLAPAGSPAFVPWWNAGNGLVAFVAVAWLLAALKAANERLEERVVQRTAELATAEERFRQMAEGINDVFWMTDAAGSQVLYVSPAYEQVWGRTCASLYAQPSSKPEAIHPEDRPALPGTAAGYDVEYRIHRPGGGIRWIHERTFPIHDRAGAVYRIAGIATDVTGRKKLERKVLEVSDQEQQRIGQDLHDGLCQHLTATMLACKLLQEQLAERALPYAAQAGQIAAFLDEAIRQARAVARGLDPVKVATNGLQSALEELAATIQSLGGVACQFGSDAAALVEDNAVAIHLYRIAQEAVNNALKHAQPTRIQIGLLQTDGQLVLTIKDDGRGLADPGRRATGMGLHTMHYRANLLGATLQLRRRPAGGTVVTCALPASGMAAP